MDFALNLIRKQLLPRVNWHPAPTALLEKSVDLSEKIKDIFTDDIENNKGQLSQLWDQECIEVLALGVRGVGSLVKRDNNAKQKVLAILSSAIDDIRKDDELKILEVVSALESKQAGVAKAVSKAITM